MKAVNGGFYLMSIQIWSSRLGLLSRSRQTIGEKKCKEPAMSKYFTKWLKKKFINVCNQSFTIKTGINLAVVIAVFFPKGLCKKSIKNWL
jgi:hypothetical protein